MYRLGDGKRGGKAAYEGGGYGERFGEINRRVKVADLRGTVLCEGITRKRVDRHFLLPERTAEDLADSNEREKLGALNMAKAGTRVEIDDSRINGVRCDAVITGYRGVTPDRNTSILLEKLENVPFFVGVANGGIHTFVGHMGSVCDFHWTAQPDDRERRDEPRTPSANGNGTRDFT